MWRRFLHMTDFSPQAPPVVPVTNIRYEFLQCEDISSTDDLSYGKFLHMTICLVEKFSPHGIFFSTGTACGACDKYQVWYCISFIFHFTQHKCWRSIMYWNVKFARLPWSLIISVFYIKCILWILCICEFNFAQDLRRPLYWGAKVTRLSWSQ